MTVSEKLQQLVWYSHKMEVAYNVRITMTLERYGLVILTTAGRGKALLQLRSILSWESVEVCSLGEAQRIVREAAHEVDASRAKGRGEKT